MGKVIGYARVSTESQDVDLQIKALNKAGVESVVDEVSSGASLDNRVRLLTLLNALGEGDTLAVTRIDRLCRSIFDLQKIIDELQSKGVSFRCTEQNVDTSTATGKCFLDMLGVFAEFELNLRRERQLEGIEKAKKEGRYKGRVPTAMRRSQEVLTLKDKGYTALEIASELKIGKSSVYRILKSEKT